MTIIIYSILAFAAGLACGAWLFSRGMRAAETDRAQSAPQDAEQSPNARVDYAQQYLDMLNYQPK